MHDKGPGQSGGALSRVLRRAGVESLVDRLADRLSGADLTTLLLEVMRRRAARLAPADVLRRYGADRFVVPGGVPFHALRGAEDAALSALPSGFEVVTCSPVVPLGTHSALATVSQNKVISTIRGSEVAADPTNALALEAAQRRRSARDSTPVRLAAIQRVLRAQRFDAPEALAHFTLLGLVSAGRDTGRHGFEEAHAVEHLAYFTEAVRVAGHRAAQVRVTPLGDDRLAAGVADALAARGVDVVADRNRASGRGYYTDLCFKVYVSGGDDWFEVADGGFVDWTRRLLADRKERLLIGGIGLDRLVTEQPG